MSKRMNAEATIEVGLSPLLYVKCKGQVIEIPRTTKAIFRSSPTTPCQPISPYMNIKLNQTREQHRHRHLLTEVPWAPEKSEKTKRDSLKKGAGRVVQRQTDNKRRMWRQFPGDAYVWESDTSPGMG
jgi:hypothetical protein